MKTTLVRTLVFSLVFTGLTAGTVAAATPSQPTTKMMADGGVGSLPIPMCAPDDPTHCGLD